MNADQTTHLAAFRAHHERIIADGPVPFIKRSSRSLIKLVDALLEMTSPDYEISARQVAEHTLLTLLAEWPMERLKL